MKIILTIYFAFRVLVSFGQEFSLEEYNNSVVALGVRGTVEGERMFYPVGTGIITYLDLDSISSPVLITAKHVIDSLLEYNHVYLRSNSSSGESLADNMGDEIKLRYGEYKVYLPHPDSNVDLACLPLYWDILGFKSKARSFQALPYKSFAVGGNYVQGEKVCVFGFPAIVNPRYRTKPLLREGIISWTDPQDPIRNKFLIDCEIYPGNSGGPVFSIPRVKIINGKILQTPLRFMGIVTSRLRQKDYLQIDDKSKLFYSDVGLGVVEPVSKIVELLELAKTVYSQQIIDLDASLKAYFQSATNSN